MVWYLSTGIFEQNVTSEIGTGDTKFPHAVSVNIKCLGLGITLLGKASYPIYLAAV